MNDGLSHGKLVAGPWGDLSPYFHSLLKLYAEQKVAVLGRSTGEVQGPGQLGKFVGEIRGSVSMCVVRAQALCLLGRLAFLGPGAREQRNGGRATSAWWREGGERLRLIS